MSAWGDEAICLRHWEWSETSQTVALLSREHGVVRALAKGSRRERSAFSGGVELLTRGEILVVPKPAGRLSLLTAWTLRETFPAIARSLKAFHAAMYLADVTYHLIAEADAHPDYYDALVHALRGLETDPDRSLLQAQWRLVDSCGYRPRLGVEGGGMGGGERPSRLWFDPAHGRFSVEQETTGAWAVRPGTLETLRGLADTEAVASGSQPELDPRGVLGGSRLLGAYLRHILGHEIPTFRHVFGDLG